jgi:hypothetical protein
MVFTVDEILRAMAALARVSAMVMVMLVVLNFAEPIPVKAPSILYFPGLLTKSGTDLGGAEDPLPLTGKVAQPRTIKMETDTLKTPKNFFI